MGVQAVYLGSDENMGVALEKIMMKKKWVRCIIKPTTAESKEPTHT